MRVSKEPEVRKQEILEAAMKLFGEKGYEKTSITEIARAVGVAQGLCYLYFPSKEALFDSAIEQYADLLLEKFRTTDVPSGQSLRQTIEEMPIMVEDESDTYHQLFHGAENKKFHDQLSLKLCEKLVPIVKKLLLNAQEAGEIQLPDVHSAAVFCVYGQLGILLDHTLGKKEKELKIRNYFLYALRL